MKWFKHYSNAHRDRTLMAIFKKYGLEGEARFWRLVELMAERLDKNETIFYFDLETIRQSLRFRSLTDCRPFLDHLTTFTEMKVNYSGNDCVIEWRKILEIKDNHSRNLQVTDKQLASNLLLDKKEKRRREEEEEEKAATPPVNNSPDIPQDLMVTLKERCMYPEDVIREVANDAWIKFLGNPDKEKNWPRFIAHYFVNEKDSIRNFLIAKNKESSKEKTVDDWLAQIYADDEAEQEALRKQRGGLSDV